MRGAGGTEGGVGRFFLGLAMFVGGGYLFLESIRVTSGFSWGRALFQVGGLGVTGGMILIPFMIGVGLVFYNARNPLGWILAAGALVAMTFGVIASVQFHLQAMSAFELITILVLMVGGLGLLLSALRTRATPPARTGEGAA